MDKNYNPSYPVITMMCASYSAQGVCTVWVPITNIIPECWELTLRSGDKTGSVCVDQKEYDSIQIGDLRVEK